MATAVSGWRKAQQLRISFQVGTETGGILDSRRLYLASNNTLSLLSRPKGRNSRGEELGRGRWETASPQGRENLFGRLARLPRAAPFKRPNRI